MKDCGAKLYMRIFTVLYCTDLLQYMGKVEEIKKGKFLVSEHLIQHYYKNSNMLKCIMIENFSYLIQSIKKCMEYILFGPSVSCQNINYKTFCGKKQKKRFALPYCMSIPVALEAKKTMKMKILLETIWHFTEISKFNTCKL